MKEKIAGNFQGWLCVSVICSNWHYNQLHTVSLDSTPEVQLEAKGNGCGVSPHGSVKRVEDVDGLTV